MFEMLDNLILLWVLGWSTWCTLIHDGGCVGRDHSLVNSFMWLQIDPMQCIQQVGDC